MTEHRQSHRTAASATLGGDVLQVPSWGRPGLPEYCKTQGTNRPSEEQTVRKHRALFAVATKWQQTLKGWWLVDIKPTKDLNSTQNETSRPAHRCYPTLYPVMLALKSKTKQKQNLV